MSPTTAALTLCQSQQFVAVNAPTGATLQWAVDGTVGGNAAIGTITSAGLYTASPSTPGDHTISALATGYSALGTAAVTDLAGVLTYHNDNARTGQNLQEYALTPATVASAKFGKLWSCQLDGDVYAQPLYVAHLNITSGAHQGTHNVLFIATHNDTIYAFDADDAACTRLWQTSFLVNGATVSTPTQNCTDTQNGYGITPTPVIDITAQRLYVLVATTENNQYVQRLHAVNIATGADSASVVIQATFQSKTFDPSQERPRAALALSDGGVYLSWAAFCDRGSWDGWLMRYDTATLTQTAVFDAAPNAGRGGIWMSGGAPAFDSGGAMYLTTGNGDFTDTADVIPAVAPHNDFGMAVLKFDTFDPVALNVEDFFVPAQFASWNQDDYDVSAVGITVLPDNVGPTAHPQLAISGDKEGHIYVLDRTQMGKYGGTLSNNVVQYLLMPNAMSCAGRCLFSTPTYYNNNLYFTTDDGPLIAVPLINGLIQADSGQTTVVPSSQSAAVYRFPNPTPAVSASPSGGGVAWVLDNQNCGYVITCARDFGPANLDAFDTANVATSLFSSATIAANEAGNATNHALKFNLPVVANGHVYVATSGMLTVYGLAP